MTCDDIYKSALALLPSNVSEDDSLREYIPGWINLCMRESFNVENSIRAYNKDPDKPILTSVPKVSSLSDEVPYSDVLTEYAFLYFVASLMCKDDDDSYWAQDYRARFIVALQESTMLSSENIVDVYSGDNDA